MYRYNYFHIILNKSYRGLRISRHIRPYNKLEEDLFIVFKSIRKRFLFFVFNFSYQTIYEILTHQSFSNVFEQSLSVLIIKSALGTRQYRPCMLVYNLVKRYASSHLESCVHFCERKRKHLNKHFINYYQCKKEKRNILRS